MIQHETSPALATGANVSSTVTSPSFSPPSGSFLVAQVVANSSNTGTTTAALTDTEGLVWTQVSVSNYTGVGTMRGHASVWVAECPDGATGMTVTATTAGSTSTTRRPTMKVDVFTGVLSAAEVNTYSGTSNVLSVPDTGPHLVVAGCEWWKAGTPTATGFTDYVAFNNSGADGVAGLFGYGAGPFSLDASGTSAVEWRAAVVGLTEAPPPADPNLGVDFVPEIPDSRLRVELAWGADVSGDPELWEWTDVTEDVRMDPGISTRLGRADEASEAQAADMTLVFDNRSASYSLGGWSPNYPNVKKGVPVRVSTDVGEGFETAFVGHVNSWNPSWDHRDIPIVNISAAGTISRLSQGDNPVQSPYRRALTADPTVVAYWPMEDGKSAQYIEPVRGGSRMYWSGDPGLSSADEFLGSLPVVDVKEAPFNCFVDTYENTGQTQVRWLVEFPEDGLNDGSVIAHIYFTGGSLHRFDITYEINPPDDFVRIGYLLYDASMNLLQFNYINHNPNVTIDGEPIRMSLTLAQDGADIDWTHSLINPERGVGSIWSRTLTGATLGTVSRVEVNPWGHCDGMSFGHLTVQDVVTSSWGTWQEYSPLIAYRGEYAYSNDSAPSRLDRICSENNLPLTYHDYDAFRGPIEQMGPQPIAPLLEILREIEAMDQGLLWDGRSPGIAYTSRLYRESAIRVLEIPASSTVGFAPVDDDQQLVNRSEGKQKDGVSSVYEQTEGPLSTSAIGVYDSSIEVNALHSEAALHHAEWQVSKGTQYGYRIPAITLDLRATPEYAAAAHAVVPGDLVQITDINLGGFAPEAIDLTVEGISQEISPTQWTVTFQCSPWLGVGEAGYEDPEDDFYVLRADTDGSELSSGVAEGATSMSTTTPWTTDPDDFPMDLSVGGVKVTATACSGTLFTITPAPTSIASGAYVQLWNPSVLGLG